MTDFETRVQKRAEEHLAACEEAMWEFDEGNHEAESPAYGPFDGWTTCVVREVLSIAWDEMLAEARREVELERQVQ